MWTVRTVAAGGHVVQTFFEGYCTECALLITMCYIVQKCMSCK